jgi:hypothetical protein
MQDFAQLVVIKVLGPLAWHGVTYMIMDMCFPHPAQKTSMLRHYMWGESRDVILPNNSPLRERPTTSHRPCNVVVSIGDYLALAGHYLELFGDYSGLVGTI